MNSSSKLAVFVFSRLPRPPRSTRMDTLVPYTSLVQSQQPFVVIILCPRPARKGLGLARRDHRVERRVLDRAPLAPRLHAVVTGVGRPFGEHHLLRLHPRPRGEHAVPEARLAFIDPEQVDRKVVE